MAEGEVGQWINPFFKAQIKLVFFMVYKEMLEMWQVIEISISIWATAHLLTYLPTPPLTQQQSIDNNLRLMLG